jgi:hypothetical protein
MTTTTKSILTLTTTTMRLDDIMEKIDAFLEPRAIEDWGTAEWSWMYNLDAIAEADAERDPEDMFIEDAEEVYQAALFDVSVESVDEIIEQRFGTIEDPLDYDAEGIFDDITEWDNEGHVVGWRGSMTNRQFDDIVREHICLVVRTGITTIEVR